VRLSVALKLVEPELSWSKRHTREVECGVEAGGAGVELDKAQPGCFLLYAPCVLDSPNNLFKSAHFGPVHTLSFVSHKL
jgi:hypothetical protein